MATKVEYNGSVVATIPNGNTATLPIADKKMKSDIVITVPEAESGTDSPLPTEVSTEAEMTALLTSGEVGGVYKYTGTTGTYENGALYVLEEEAVATATVTISLTNPSYKNYFYVCNIYDDYEGTNKIGEITSATGSTSVQTSTGKLCVRVGANGVIAVGTATTSGGVTADGVDEDMSMADFKFLVTSDGTITVDGISYAD